MVTGQGDIVRCSESEEPELFEAGLAGQGQCGVIVSAALRLTRAPSHVRIFNLFYPGLESMSADIRLLVADGRFDSVLGFVVPGPAGWVHFVETLSFFTPPSEPDSAALLSGLGFVPGAQAFHDSTYFDCVNRVTVQLGDLRAVGLNTAPAPWLGLFVPGSKVDSFVGDVLRDLTPADLGRSFPILLHPFTRSPMTRPLLRVPDEEVFLSLSILRAATPGATDAATMVEHNQLLSARNLQLGGRDYPIGAVPFTPDDWQRHYEPYWDQLVRAKQRFDPGNVLTPGPGIFPG